MDSEDPTVIDSESRTKQNSTIQIIRHVLEYYDNCNNSDCEYTDDFFC